MFNLYGFTLAVAVFTAFFFAEKIQKFLAKYNKDYLSFNLDQIFPYLFLGGLIGARAYHVIDYWFYYKYDLLKVLFVWRGGLGIFGAIVGGLLALLIFNLLKFKAQWKKYLFLQLDILAFCLPLAQAIGRFGNFFNQELYGLPSSLPWAVYIKPENRVVGLENFSYFHPLFFYESILNFILFCIFLFLLKKKKIKAGFIYIYCLSYGLIRFFLEFLRINPWQLFFFTTGQWLSLIMIFLGIIGLIKKQENLDNFLN
ncbi:prolipoprotein diacylglyceryl transferase [Candidatus Beckwithbacteria bacterium]|nr:prolipoprotein diacylglyceryl transferase [Candidatus Beckwithbacteria bacterium]